MVNALGVFRLGRRRHEAEAAMLGQPSSMLIPDVVGFKLKGRFARRRNGDRPRSDRHGDASQEGRRRKNLSILRQRTFEPQRSRRATIANNGPRIRRDDGLFPRRCGNARISVLHRASARAIALVEAYCKEQALFARTRRQTRSFPTLWNSTSARSNRRWPARSVRKTACHSPKQKRLHESHGRSAGQTRAGEEQRRFVRSFKRRRRNRSHHGVARTLRTLRYMLGAGLLAKKAVERGLQVKPG